MTNRLLQTLITAQAERQPDSIALVMHKEKITYGQLEQWSNQLARLLKVAGCEAGDRVCLLLPKSVAAIVGMLGVLKADCIYVPMDITGPLPRMRMIIDSCECRAILANSASLGRLRDLQSTSALGMSVNTVWMDPGPVPASIDSALSWDDLKSASDEPLDYRNTTQDVAHILFTSGSTGVPKGVTITHSNVTHFLDWAVPYFGFSPSDRISGHPPLHFDLSTFDIFGTLSSGAQLYLVPPELSLLPHKLVDFIRSSELTQWFSVPSLLNYIAKFDVVKEGDFPALKRLLWCGETFPTPALMYWMRHLPHVSFTNLYGPTEATIASSYYRVPDCPNDERALIPIGAACGGEALLVLDEELRFVEPGQIADLYIRGVGLSPGYWRDPIKTAAAFLDNPHSFDPMDRIYRTGDLASVGSDGLVYLHGRSDSQIKSRGYRIELGEIERALHAMGGLRESAVVGVEMDGFEGVAIACAYVPAENNEITPQTIRKKLADVVPHYMVPSHWLSLPSLPQNGNGKIDRPKLREQFKGLRNTTAA